MLAHHRERLRRVQPRAILRRRRSVRSTGTDVASDRAVSQVVDTTNRARRRRNGASSSATRRGSRTSSRCLRAKYVGHAAPELFSVAAAAAAAFGRPGRPEPVVPATARAALELASRASRNSPRCSWCRTVRTSASMRALRRVCLLDSPPGTVRGARTLHRRPAAVRRMVQYLHRTFPPGTPLEELDIDIIARPCQAGTVPPAGGRVVGAAAGRGAGRGVDRLTRRAAGVARSTAAPTTSTFLEVWLDTLRDEYEREVSRSPLERGVLFGENRFLDTCFGTEPGGGRNLGHVTRSTLGQPADSASLLTARRLRHRRDQDLVVAPADASRRGARRWRPPRAGTRSSGRWHELLSNGLEVAGAADRR